MTLRCFQLHQLARSPRQSCCQSNFHHSPSPSPDIHTPLPRPLTSPIPLPTYYHPIAHQIHTPVPNRSRTPETQMKNSISTPLQHSDPTSHHPLTCCRPPHLREREAQCDWERSTRCTYALRRRRIVLKRTVSVALARSKRGVVVGDGAGFPGEIRRWCDAWRSCKSMGEGDQCNPLARD